MVDSYLDGSKALNTVGSYLRTFDALTRYIQLVLDTHDSNLTQAAVMNALYIHSGRMRPTDISKWVFRAKRTVTSVLNTLEKTGIVKRERSKTDRRSVEVVMTERGYGKIEELLPVMQDISKNVLSGLDKKQVETLAIVLNQLRKHLLTLIDSS